MSAAAFVETPWREPLEVMLALADEPWAIGFISGGDDAEWSYVAAEPDSVLVLARDDARDPFEALKAFSANPQPHQPDGPPFQGGVAGLASYELGDRIEALGLGRMTGWPDLACGRYASILAFDHQRRRLLAMGPKASSWLKRPPRRGALLATSLQGDDPRAFEAAVGDVVGRIRAGEIFQANLARSWSGRLDMGQHPSDLLAALAQASPAPFAAYLRLPDRAVVSNSPERFVRIRRDQGGLLVRSEPIKGTAPRGATPDADRALAIGLAASQKDRAENLMIVDLMRNDLARVSTPGEVRTPELFRVITFPNVHHLVSTVTGRLEPGRTAIDLLRAAFPPGSITGAPKVQAMKVIAGHEPPRGPFFGSMFHLSGDGSFDSSVLIRTAAFTQDAEGWSVEARAGAGIVADSDPMLERIETETKISTILKAFDPQGPQRPASSR